MDWSPLQDRALREVSQWLERREKQVFRLFGYAGTGKTTLARHLAEGVDGDVRFAAFTGKAAQVLREMGCGEASTIHSLMYRAREKSRSRLKELEAKLAEALNAGHPEHALEPLRRAVRDERQNLSRPTFDLSASHEVRKLKLIVIDECSMVDGRMGEDLLSLGVPVLVLGDPAQLPPVAGGGFFTEGVEPDVMLTEIHRQARDNPIISLATEIREGRSLAIGSYGESKVVAKADLDPDDIFGADQLLVGKNITRRASIRRFRDRLGYEHPYPLKGEKLICLRNNHDLGVLNGALFTAAADAITGSCEDRLLLALENDPEPIDVEVHTFPFLGQGKDEMPWYERLEANEMDYGYAITVHKSQGSQFKSVAVLDEWHIRESRQRWLYTAVTRAREKVIVVKM